MAENSGNVIHIDNLVKTFGKTKALDGLNLDVKSGEIHGFLGPNGAGKSTTIRVLLGLLKKDSGNVSVFDQDPWQDSVQLHKRISYIPGEVNLWPNLTGGEIIDLLGNLRGGFDKKVKAELIELFNLDPTKKFQTYSKGNRQKVAIIAAFVSEADLYLMDEPTSGLDPLLENYFQDYLKKEVKSKNKTILLSSHILAEVDKLCDRVSIIKEGKTMISDSLDNLRQLTHTSITAQTKEPLQKDLFKNVKNVHSIEINDNVADIKVDAGSIDEVMQVLVKKQILKLTSTPPTLEELFMSHYTNDETN